MSSSVRLLFALLVAAAGVVLPARAQIDAPMQKFDPTQDVGIDQRLGEQLPLDARFKDEAGREVALSEYFGKRPVVLSFVYFECPMLCTQVLDEQVRAMRVLDLVPGEDYVLITISIDPSDTPEDATLKKEAYLEALDKPEAAAAWHYLVGEPSQIERVTRAAGFRYVYDEEQKQYAHAGGIMVATAQGVLSRYFYGIEYSPRDLSLSLVEAGDGQVGSLVDQFLMLCFHYDPKTGKYGPSVMLALRILGTGFVLLVIGYVLVQLRREGRARKVALAGTPAER